MSRLSLGLVLALAIVGASFAAQEPAPPADLHVDPVEGDDGNSGTAARPLKTLGGAVAKLPAEIRMPVTVHLKNGKYAESGREQPAGWLVLDRAMWPEVSVTFAGPGVLDWEGGDVLVLATRGRWAFRGVQLGTGRKRQRNGFACEGPALLELRDVRVRTSSFEGAGILARRGGRVHLAGTIGLNEEFHDKAPEESFCSILAEDHGVVRFTERDGASLSMGNGSLRARYYGVIRLGCQTARVTTWAMSNAASIGNSGRIDFQGTATVLKATNPRNTPIGPEDDGHLMAEDTPLVLEGCDNDWAVMLQKSSAFFATNLTLKGKFRNGIHVGSGSVFAGVVKGELGSLRAVSGGHLTLQDGSARPKGSSSVAEGGTITLPGGSVIR